MASVGHAQQRDVGLDRLGPQQVAVELVAIERHLVDQEAQAQVMACERRHVRAQPLAGPQARQRGARHLGPLFVVAREADAPVRQLDAGLRLGDVVQQRAEAQPAAAGELVGQGLGEQRADRRGQRLVAQRGRGIALEVDAGLQDLEGVAVHVAVVVGVLLDPAQRRELG
jgi:hypothetical protein